MKEINNNKKVLRRRNFFVENQCNQFNQFNGVEKRSNQSFHMKPSVASSSREYAKASNIATGEFAERAFIEYMVNHPLDIKPVLIQQIADSIPERRDNVRMKAVGRKLEMFMGLIDKLGEEDSSKLEEKLLTWILKGTEIKKPSPEFMELLERAEKYV